MRFGSAGEKRDFTRLYHYCMCISGKITSDIRNDLCVAWDMAN